jgi:aryl-alcohol dehydrogenase-like predicted oxidoreductase
VNVQTRNIGSLAVSVVGLGCNNFGWRVDAAGTRAVVHAALDVGVNFFDTADTYGGSTSEELLAAALAGRRSQAIIATKFGMEVAPGKKGAKPAYIREAVEASLRRLKTDVIDLYQLHRPDPETPIADTVGALAELVAQGKVREVGCSNFDASMLREARAAGGACFVSVQNDYSMLKRSAEAGVLAECARLGMGFLPYWPLASGVLSGKYGRDKHPSGTRVEKGNRFGVMLTEQTYALIDEASAWAAQRGRSLLDLAFGWLLAHDMVASVIAGATSAGQVQANARAGMWVLAPDERAAVDALLARHGFLPSRAGD